MENLYSQLVNYYNKKNRAYHNMNHIKVCLHEFEQVKSSLKYPHDVELAIWFHDIIYDPKSPLNEDKSAEFAATALKNLNVDSHHIGRVKDLILATKHDKAITNRDAQYLVDIDISILGYPPELFLSYEKSIRKEYKWVPQIIYRKKRKQLLMSFLNREKIYYTEPFSELYESQSRINLNAAIKSLQTSHS